MGDFAKFYSQKAPVVTNDPFLQPDSELVLGLVAPLGADPTEVQRTLADRLRNHFHYESNVIRLGRLIRELELDVELVDSPAAEKYSSLMSAGTRARESSGRGDYLALSAIFEIHNGRQREERGRLPLKRRAHILCSLKHPDEVRTLRRVYGPGFFLIGIHATREDRIESLVTKRNIPRLDAEQLTQRDDNEGSEFGQRTRDTFEPCDAFISLNSEDYQSQLHRILDLLFAKPDLTPTRDEHAMHLAYASSLRSRDLSRQVGAIITSKSGEIIATGANDVPKYGGGLYWTDDGKEDRRDWQRGYDSNEHERNTIGATIVRDLLPHEDGDDLDLVSRHRAALANSGLLDLTEFGRAVHAEMEALLSCTRAGVSPKEGTLYSTTFPCHNCAKHIIAAGIHRVVYVEPYPKSRAYALHDDSLSLKGEPNKVCFEPFVGIGPRRFFDLFSMRLSSGSRIRRKTKDSGGKKAHWSREEAHLRVPMATMSYIEREALVVRELLKPVKAEAE